MDISLQVALVSAVFVAYSLVATRLDRWAISGPMIFLVFGVLVSPDMLDLVDLAVESSFVERLAELTLVVVLFADAARIRLGLVRGHVAVPARLLLVALPVSIGLGLLVGLVLLDVPWEVAALIAAVLAPTDAALGKAVVTSRAVPIRVRQMLNIESGLNDGMSVPFVTAFVAVTAADEGLRTPAYWLTFAFEQIGFGVLVGVVVGIAGGLGVRRATEAGWTSRELRPVGMLTLAIGAWGLAEGIGGNGFIAAFVAGLAAGRITREACAGLFDFVEREGQLFTLLTFFTFGGVFVATELDALDVRIAAYVVASLTIVRMVPVALSLLGLRLAPVTLAFVGWFGPRGLASIVLALFAIEEIGPSAASDTIGTVVTWTVLVSVVAHGLTARPLARAYARSLRARTASRATAAEYGPVPAMRSRFGEMPMSDEERAATSASGRDDPIDVFGDEDGDDGEDDEDDEDDEDR